MVEETTPAGSTGPPRGSPTPQGGESPEAFLARLRAEQRRIEELIEAVERGMRPGPPPATLPPRRPVAEIVPARLPGSRVDRRVGAPDRRTSVRDRRRGPADRRRPPPRDPRGFAPERRAGPPDRRSGRPDRRLGHDRRAVGPVAAEPRVDPTLVFWIVNVLCWAALTAFVLLYGWR